MNKMRGSLKDTKYSYLLFPHWLIENIKGSGIIGNKIEFAGAEMDDRTPIIGIRPLSLLSRVVYLRQKCAGERSVEINMTKISVSDPHGGEGLQPVPRTARPPPRAQPHPEDQRAQHGRHRHHPAARHDVRLQGEIKSEAWI